MNNDTDHTKLTAYISFPVSEFDKFKQIAEENGLRIDLLTTKEHFNQMRFKQNAPHA